jgi:nucleotide-binding universal stress UspA family protein
MVHVDVDVEFCARVSIAADLADRFPARLIGVAGWAPMPVFLGERAPDRPNPNLPELQDMKAVLDQKGERFYTAIGKDGRQLEWRSALDFPTEVLAREARAADMVIIGNKTPNHDPFRALDPGAFLVKAGCPVLVVPESVTSLLAKRIAIAWKDVREARRAVRDALPLLQQAERVTVAEISEMSERSPGAHHLYDVATYLTRHGVESVSVLTKPAEGTIAESLLRLAYDENIDLIVAGAYGHSRLGEWVFGGVTRDLLAQQSVCCFFSH